MKIKFGLTLLIFGLLLSFNDSIETDYWVNICGLCIMAAGSWALSE